MTPQLALSLSTLVAEQVIRTWRSHVVAGADYFFNPQWSAFVEYNYLNYQSTQINTTKIAIWANSWWAPVCDSFSTNSEQFSPIG